MGYYNRSLRSADVDRLAFVAFDSIVGFAFVEPYSYCGYRHPVAPIVDERTDFVVDLHSFVVEQYSVGHTDDLDSSKCDRLEYFGRQCDDVVAMSFVVPAMLDGQVMMAMVTDCIDEIRWS